MLLRYLCHRLFLVIPTLLGILLLNFVIMQAAPGGPVQQLLLKMRSSSTDDISMMAGESTNDTAHNIIDPDLIKKLETQFGFDKPAHVRFWHMIKNYVTFDLGESYFKHARVTSLIRSKLPASLSLAFWTMLIVYLLSIPLGIQKAIRNGSYFDFVSSVIVIIAFAVPSFLFALFLLSFFAGGGVFEIFPLRGLFSIHYDSMTWWQKIKDYTWHLILPVSAMAMSGFAKITLLTKNSFLEEIRKHYVLTARAKGLSQRRVLYGHIFKNAAIVIFASAPSVLIAILLVSSLLIEVLFSLDGLGFLSFEAAISRDYPVMFGCLYVFTLIGMGLHLLSDLCMMFVDKRINLTDSKL